jgi:hypothetical protein
MNFIMKNLKLSLIYNFVAEYALKYLPFGIGLISNLFFIRIEKLKYFSVNELNLNLIYI